MISCSFLQNSFHEEVLSECIEFKFAPYFSGFFQSHRACTLLRQKAKQNIFCLYLLIPIGEKKNHLILKKKKKFILLAAKSETEFPRSVAFKPLAFTHLPWVLGCATRVIESVREKSLSTLMPPIKGPI